MYKLITSVYGFLELKKPYRVILQSSMRKNAALYIAHYTQKKGLLRHIIKINMSNIPDDVRNLECLVVHELIHAWQEEKGHTDIHGKSFQKMAILLEEYTGIQKLYLPDTDSP